MKTENSLAQNLPFGSQQAIDSQVGLRAVSSLTAMSVTISYSDGILATYNGHHLDTPVGNSTHYGSCRSLQTWRATFFDPNRLTYGFSWKCQADLGRFGPGL